MKPPGFKPADLRLQWGRAHVSAETRLQGNQLPRFLPASMGPRSRERGNSMDVVVGIVEDDASMGPRSRERGNLTKITYMAYWTS